MASTTETRCSHCLMVVEVTADAAVDHDFPYAVDAYGRCKGSGQSPLTGPATPPAAWGAHSGAFVDVGALPSPLPTVKRTGWTVTLTGVRFIHSTHCRQCREIVYVATEGGVIEFGFDHRGHSFENLHARARASYDGSCPNGCGTRVVFRGHSQREAQALPASDSCTVQGREWERLRRDLDVHTANMTLADLARLAPDQGASKRHCGRGS